MQIHEQANIKITKCSEARIKKSFFSVLKFKFHHQNMQYLLTLLLLVKTESHQACMADSLLDKTVAYAFISL